VLLAFVKRRCRKSANISKKHELFNPAGQVKSEKFARFDDASNVGTAASGGARTFHAGKVRA